MAKRGVMLDLNNFGQLTFMSMILSVCVRCLLILSELGSEIQVRIFVQYQV